MITIEYNGITWR